jgi:hypothetical protein
MNILKKLKAKIATKEPIAINHVVIRIVDIKTDIPSKKAILSVELEYKDKDVYEKWRRAFKIEINESLNWERVYSELIKLARADVETIRKMIPIVRRQDEKLIYKVD